MIAPRSMAEEAIRDALTKVHGVERLVKDFGGEGSGEELARRLNDFVASLGEVRNSAKGIEAEFPNELVRRVDTGANPDRFVLDALHTCVVENQKAKGKATNLQKFRDALLDQASVAFPAEAEAYRELKRRG